MIFKGEHCSLFGGHLQVGATHWDVEASQFLHAFLFQNPVCEEGLLVTGASTKLAFLFPGGRADTCVRATAVLT